MSSGMNGTKSRGVFASLAELQAAELRTGVTVWVHGGSRYDIYNSDQGGGVPLDNGNWAQEVGGSSGGGESNTASNIGTGAGVFAQKSGVDLQFKSIKASGGASVSSDSDSITIDTSALILASEKGATNGIATLVGDKVPADQLPSYVDDVLEFPTFGDFPISGESGKIYVALDTNAQYRWAGSTYVEFGSGSTTWGSITGTISNQTDLQNALDTKQGALVSGTNIKTVGGESLLGSGDIPLPSGGSLNPQVAEFTQTADISSGNAGVIPFYDATKFSLSSETTDIAVSGNGILLKAGSYHLSCIASAFKGSAPSITGVLKVVSVSGDSIDTLIDSTLYNPLTRHTMTGCLILKISQDTVINLELSMVSTVSFETSPPSGSKIPYNLRITKL